MINKLKQFIKPRYQTLNEIRIGRQQILDNYKVLEASQPQAAIFPVLKSNAYGHGLKELCLILNDSRAPFVIVDSFPEAQIVYHYFKRKVLILGEMPAKAYSYCNLKRSEFCIYNKESLSALAELGRARVHLFVNSGMNREGIKDLESFLMENAELLKRVEITGLCSHLAASEEVSNLNHQQLEKFLDDLNILRSKGFNPKWVHLGNSAAIFSFNHPALTAYRSGLALYGYSPYGEDSVYFSKTSNLKPALRLSSTVVSLQSLRVNDVVSYNGTYQAQAEGKIAVIPFGYYEGLNRGLSNLASLIWEKSGRREYLKIAGRICMNLCCLAVGDLDVKIGDEIEIISGNNLDKNSLNNLSKISGHIPYELLVGLQSNIRRIIV
ncbi:MAG: alanine racemase [Candidatus Falkowbacteria bacterium]